jgi:sugar (pentulose or hexulose) kinase
VHRFALDPRDAPANVRAVIEAQMMAMAIHSRWMGVRVGAIRATGGAARNREILQVMADVFGANVHALEISNSACLGAALRAYHADAHSEGRPVGWDEAVAGFTDPPPGQRLRPDPDRRALYAELASIYTACEDHALRNGPDPTPRIEAFRKSWTRPA